MKNTLRQFQNSKHAAAVDFFTLLVTMMGIIMMALIVVVIFSRSSALTFDQMGLPSNQYLVANAKKEMFFTSIDMLARITSHESFLSSVSSPSYLSNSYLGGTLIVADTSTTIVQTNFNQQFISDFSIRYTSILTTELSSQYNAQFLFDVTTVGISDLDPSTLIGFSSSPVLISEPIQTFNSKDTQNFQKDSSISISVTPRFSLNLSEHPLLDYSKTVDYVKQTIPTISQCDTKYTHDAVSVYACTRDLVSKDTRYNLIPAIDLEDSYTLFPVEYYSSLQKPTFSAYSLASQLQSCLSTSQSSSKFICVLSLPPEVLISERKELYHELIILRKTATGTNIILNQTGDFISINGISSEALLYGSYSLSYADDKIALRFSSDTQNSLSFYEELTPQSELYLLKDGNTFSFVSKTEAESLKKAETVDLPIVIRSYYDLVPHLYLFAVEDTSRFIPSLVQNVNKQTGVYEFSLVHPLYKFAVYTGNEQVIPGAIRLQKKPPKESIK